MKKIYLILVVLCIPAGFITKNEHAVFWWDNIPSIDAVFGVFGAVLLLVATKVVHFITHREENYYD